MRLSDRQHLVRDSETEGLEVVRSDGSYVIASGGRKYIDFVMGWCVGNLGWGNEGIRKAIRDFQGPDYVSPGYIYRPWIELSELLASIAPGKLTKCLRATGGTEAVDFALRAAIAHTGRRRFIAVEGAYHGNSIGAVAVGSGGSQVEKTSPFIHCDRIKLPLDGKAAARLEKFLKKRDVAALIMEPVVCNLAVLVPGQDFMARIQGLCRKYGALVIMDEVATGFGRTGKLFASEHFGIEPDILCVAKAITGGYAPMGATLLTEEVARSFKKRASYYSTYGWHPLSVAAALANLKILVGRKDEILGHVNKMGRYFLERLSSIEFKTPPVIRIKGLAIGLDLASGNHAARIAEKARERGLLLSDLNEESLAMFPTLNLEMAVARRGLDIFEECCEAHRASHAA